MDILVDFDGTCVTHEFPKVGKEIGAVEVLKDLVKNGHRIILFTMRSDRFKKGDTGSKEISDVTGLFLQDAVDWFKKHNIPLYGIQKNPTQHKWTSSPKAYGHMIIDDTALGCPLKYEKWISEKPFVDWVKVRRFLTTCKMI